VVVGISTGKPYTEVVEGDYIIREFSGDIVESELIWHRDKKTRKVTVLQGEGWKIQMDNSLPEELEKGNSYYIPKMEYHRIIKGKGNLLIQIQENNYD
jgi:quercetin dioxygenase-like cupin family protein